MKYVNIMVSDNSTQL